MESTVYVQDAPIQTKSDFSTVATRASSGGYLVAALDEDKSDTGKIGTIANIWSHATKQDQKSQIVSKPGAKRKIR